MSNPQFDFDGEDDLDGNDYPQMDGVRLDCSWQSPAINDGWIVVNPFNGSISFETIL